MFVNRVAKYLDRMANAGTPQEGCDVGTKIKPSVGRPPRDAGRAEALADNVSHMWPFGFKTLWSSIRSAFPENHVKKPETIKAIYAGDGPSVVTDTVTQIAAISECEPDDLFTPGFWKTWSPHGRPRLADETAVEIGGVMDDLAEAIDADPSRVAAVSAALMQSELKHLHAFVTGWMHNRLMRRQAHTLLEATGRRPLESTND